MSEEVKNVQSEDQVQDEMKFDSDGIPEVSANDLLDAFGMKDEMDDEPREEPAKETPVVPTEAVEPEKPAETSKKRIKHNGQEVEVEPERELEYLQKGFDYTQKMQALANERELLTPHIGIIKAMQSDPTLQRMVADHLSGVKPEVKATEKPKFEDPIEELKWEIRQEMMKEVEEKYMKPMKAQTTQMTHQQALQSVRTQVQSDPNFQEIQQGIISNLQQVAETVGPEAANTLMRQLDQDPNAYMKAFQTMKAKIEKNKTTTTVSPEKKPLPEPTRKVEHAPILEGGGSGSPTESETKASDKRSRDLNRRARQGDLKALGELLLSGGMMKGIID
jgi:hypothetical protein